MISPKQRYALSVGINDICYAHRNDLDQKTERFLTVFVNCLRKPKADRVYSIQSVNSSYDDDIKQALNIYFNKSTDKLYKFLKDNFVLVKDDKSLTKAVLWLI